MFWNRSNAIGLATASCSQCRGHGLRDDATPCGCVLRAIFRACYTRFRELATLGPHIGTAALEFSPSPSGSRMYGRKYEEFVADFCLIARRELDEVEYKLFRYMFVLGADWKLAGARMNLDRGGLFHVVYRIEEKLGRQFAEVEPYPLYPLDEYFGGIVRKRALRERREAFPPMRLRKRRLRDRRRDHLPMTA